MKLVARAAATLGAVWSTVALFSGGWGLWGALLGALLGILAGQRIARTRIRWQWLIVGPLLVLTLGRLLSEMLVEISLFSLIFGPSLALGLGAFVWFLVLGFSLVSSIRAAAARNRQLIPLEFGVLTAGLAISFATHRDGALGRPLWLSDWAWSHGWAPATVLLWTGGLAAATLIVLWALEAKAVFRASALLVALLPLLLIWVVDFAGKTAPPTASGLADIQEGYDGEGERASQAEGGGAPPAGASDRGKRDSQTEDQGEKGDERGKGKKSEPKKKGDERKGEPERAGEGQKPGEQNQDESKGNDSKPDEKPGQGKKREGEPSSRGPPGGSAGEQSGSPTEEPPGGSEGEPPPKPPDLYARDTDAPPPQHADPIAIVILGDDYRPPLEYFYFRQEPHSQFNGRRLVPAARDYDRDYLREFAPAESEVEWTPPAEHRVMIRAKVALLAEHTAPFALEAPVSFSPEPNPYPQRFVATYGFISLAISDFESLLLREVGDPSWDERTWAHYTQAPVDPRYAALVARIKGEMRAEPARYPVAVAVAIKLHLDQTVTYSMRQRLSDSEDPTADFLFGDRVGYCVHNAHAMTYLMRAAGLPARIGTGYAVPESHERGGAILISNNQAHAWPELFVRDIGWVPIDISPSRVLDDPSEPLDEEALKQLAKMARYEPEEEQRYEDRNRLWAAIEPYLWRIVVSLIVALLVCLYVIKLWRRTWRFWATDDALPRMAYRDAVDRLAEIGRVRRWGESRESFAARLAGEHPSFTEATALHGAGTLGWPYEEAPTATPRPEFSKPVWTRLLRRLRRELKRSTPLWRRSLGWLNPVSFYWSR